MIKILSQRELEKTKVKAADMLIGDEGNKDLADLLLSLVKTIEDLRLDVELKGASIKLSAEFLSSSDLMDSYRSFIRERNSGGAGIE